MSPIQVSNIRPNTFFGRFVQTAKQYAKVIDSRESTYRLALDLTAFDIPTLGAAVFRNFWNFLEAAWEAGIGTVMVFLAPHITTFVGKIASKFILNPEEQNNTDNYLRFSMGELNSNNEMQNSINRIKKEEPKDQAMVAKVFREIGKEEFAKEHDKKAENIKKFCNGFKANDDIRDKVYRLKRAVIIGESLIEGGVWGGFGLSLRLFRKYILRKERFTGTMGYLSDTESSGLGEGGEMNWFQKLCGVGAIFLSPVLNTILLSKTKDKKNVQNSKFLSTVDSHLDMTHGVYPKLGLLFTYTSVPKWVGILITSQGWYERIERIFKFLTIIPSWWLGHRVTNGILAKSADKYLAKKYGIKEGILIEPQCVKPKDISKLSFFDKLQYSCPEPARIHHIRERIESENLAPEKKIELQKEADDLHAKTLYKGFALHSFLVWAITMLVNYTTKLRVKHALGE